MNYVDKKTCSDFYDLFIIYLFIYFKIFKLIEYKKTTNNCRLVKSSSKNLTTSLYKYTNQK